MNVQERLAHALCSEEPTVSLADAVRAMVAQGQDRDRIYEELELLRTRLQKDGRESDEDSVLEVMDFLTGFSSPHARI
jgi:hypothetical protein